MATVGVILAGGQGRRLGGVDKALVSIGGEPALARVVSRLLPQCDGLVLNANGDPARFSGFGLPVVADETADYPGPLAGVLAGFDHVAAHFPQASHVVSLPADTPFAPRDLVARLLSAREKTGAKIVVAASGGRTHHAVALWPLSLRQNLRDALVNEQLRKVSAFEQRFALAVEEWSIEPYDPFFNINTPEDLVRAEGIARMT